MKREPTLADRILSVDATKLRDSGWNAERQRRLVFAKKFVLDAQAATYIGRMLRDHPRIVSDANDFAQRPFEHMWIEMPFKGFYEAITGRPADPDGDQRVGYLFDGPVVNVAAGAGTMATSGFIPSEYILNRPMSVEDQCKLCDLLQISRLGIDLMLWGESAHAFGNQGATWDAEGLRSLRTNHTMRIKQVEGLSPERMRVAIDGSAGDLRNIIGLLLFLNRTADIQTVREEGMSHGMINRKPRPLMPHRVISLRVNPMPRLIKLAADHDHIMRRLHDVRGHYCHDRLARAGCQHGSELGGDFGEAWTEYEPLRWKCQDCGGKRWWRHEHSRGTAEVGVSTQSYAVTA